MQRLLEFLRTHASWLLFLLIEAVALGLLFNGSLYHRFVNVTTSNALLGRIYVWVAEGRGYMGLREKNRQLVEQNALLMRDYLELKQQLAYGQADTVRPLYILPDTLGQTPPFDYKVAAVLSRSIEHKRNLLVVDKGRLHGIAPQMGVVTAGGVVGIVASVAENFSVVVPLINADLRLSCKLIPKGYSATLAWDGPTQAGELVARLVDLSTHALIAEGDTVVTSGFSAVFPPNMYVGRIGKIQDQSHEQSLRDVPVELGVHFATLDFVYIITEGVPLNKAFIDSLTNSITAR